MFVSFLPFFRFEENRRHLILSFFSFFLSNQSELVSVFIRENTLFFRFTYIFRFYVLNLCSDFTTSLVKKWFFFFFRKEEKDSFICFQCNAMVKGSLVIRNELIFPRPRFLPGLRGLCSVIEIFWEIRHQFRILRS